MASTNDYLTFEYDFDSIMNKIMRMNQLRVKELFSEKGDSLFERYNITTDDTDTIKVFLENSIYQVLGLMMHLTHNVTSAAKVDVNNKYGVTINNRAQQNANAVNMLKNKIEQVFILDSLRQWYEVKGIKEEILFWTSRFDVQNIDLNNSLLEFSIRG